MAPSQLKRLRQSLREQGLVGPQQSKKSNRSTSNEEAAKRSRELRAAKLQVVRDRFNPFDFKLPDAPKFAVLGTNGRNISSVHRPGATKTLGEEKRRNTLFVEMQRRRKTGGITDRRFGEDDPQMTPEQKSLHRFVREREISGQTASMFDLEEPIDDNFLTHLGQNLAQSVSDQEPSQLTGHHSMAANSAQDRGTKRRRISFSESESDLEQGSDTGVRTPPKSRKEAMEDIIARSKLQKYERQKEKEDDDDLRAELDKGLSDVFSALRNNRKDVAKPMSKPHFNSSASLNPDRQALIEGKDRRQADKEYDERLRQMIVEQRAKPAEPTITEEEKLQRQAEKVKKQEELRLRRMKGEVEDDEISQKPDSGHTHEGDMDLDERPSSTFGLGSGLSVGPRRPELSVEEEDEFLIDEDGLSEDLEDDSELDQSSEEDLPGSGVLEESLNELNFDEAATVTMSALSPHNATVSTDFSDPYSCPRSLKEFLDLTEAVDTDQVASIVQRLRAIYHPQLNADNKAKLATLSTILIEYIYYSATELGSSNSGAAEAIIRHIHSLAKMFPVEVGNAFRDHLGQIAVDRPAHLNVGDLIILTAIGSIFPTSDHFHPVVTPAMLCMTRYLSQSTPKELKDIATGTFVCTLCLQYQTLAQRYVAEAGNYAYQILESLLPVAVDVIQRQVPNRLLPISFRMRGGLLDDEKSLKPTILPFGSILSIPSDENERESLKVALLMVQLRHIDKMIDLYQMKSSFGQIMHPFDNFLSSVLQAKPANQLPELVSVRIKEVTTRLRTSIKASLESRRPLALQNHRPLPIKTSLPKFDESFNPDKHNDPDADRAELSKLKAQHKKEKKGALRELRKDARFMAREDLREKKERDAAYEKKFKRLVAEIQGEEGHESKAYEKEKRKRLGKK